MPRRPTRYYPDYGPLLPTSGPDWRWARAVEIVTSRRNASLHRDGPDIVRAIRFLRESRDAVTGTAMKRLLRQDPDLMMAVQLAQGGRRQLELHARVLAGQSAGIIALEMGITRSIVETYGLMFFDIAGRLGATTYILHRAIKMPLDGPPTPEVLLMLCAYYHGPLVIEPWLDYLDHPCDSYDLATPEGRQRESIDLLVAAHSLTSNAETNVSLIRRTNLIRKPRSNLFRPWSVRREISANVSALLQELHWQEAQKGAVAQQSGRNTQVGSRKKNQMRQVA